MRIAVLGAGLMGPAITMDCVNSDDVDEVLLIDIDEERLDKVAVELGNPLNLRTVVQDVTNRSGLVEALKGCDVAAIALLRWLNIDGIWGAIEAGVDAVDLSSRTRTQKEWEEINRAAKKAGVTIVPGCGVEPGLADMLAAYGMDMLDSVESVDIWCGGLPQEPKPPLDYKIVFGGSYLPLRPGMVKVIEDGEVCEVERYTLGEPVYFDGIDQVLECFYDGFPETLYEVEKFKGVRWCTEKTVRYQGYCEKVNFLHDCGLLSREPIKFKDQEVVPFEVFSETIHPKVRLKEGEKDVTVLRVVVEGVKDGLETSYTFDMVDFYDEERGVTSMAKTTGYTAAIVARMLGRGEISEKGIIPPVRVVRGDLFRRLLRELEERGVDINLIGTTQQKMP